MLVLLDRRSCARSGSLLLTAFAWLSFGCASDLAQRQTPTELVRQEEWTAWSQAMNTWDPSIGEEFLRRYPDSVYRQRVQEKIEELRTKAKDRPIYEPFVQKNTVEGYKEFISNNPDNAFVPDARDRLAELEYAPYRNLNTITSYQEFLLRYLNHKYTQDAKERLEALQRPPQSPTRANFSRPSEFIVTAGPLSYPYEPLGEVHVDTRGMMNLGSILTDSLFRSPLARAIQETPTANIEQMNQLLREQARQQYGSRVDAVLNVTYRTEPDGDVYASGLAVHLYPSGGSA